MARAEFLVIYPKIKIQFIFIDLLRIVLFGCLSFCAFFLLN